MRILSPNYTTILVYNSQCTASHHSTFPNELAICHVLGEGELGYICVNVRKHILYK